MATIINQALTTLARQKIFLGIRSDRHDSLLVQLINQTTGFIEQYCKRSFLSQDYTDEEYDSTGNPVLILKQFPVTAVSSVKYNGATDNTDDWQTYDTKSYFWYEDGRIVKQSGSFPIGPQKLRATYTAGYIIDFNNENDSSKHTLPPELEYVCQKLVAALFNTRRAEGMAQERIGDSGVTLKKMIFGDEETKVILDKYVSITI